jgi:hypothetical protein
VIVVRELEREGLGLAGRHAARRGVELRKHAPLADAEREVLRAAALERLPVDRPVEIDGQPVAVLRGTACRRVGRALLAQDGDRLLDRRIVDGHLRTLDGLSGEIAHLHFRVDLESRAELERRRRRAVARFFCFRLDARITGDLEVRLLYRIAESFLHRVAQHLGAHLRAIRLSH